ncbi:branched-chain amino acid transport system II carrier protein [Kistimonas scapharcae]|uniref:Branched-chain amino acid transport system carrier protein n=1 Tax=Kistimonas scapharcae TaxID=1036133 RepID=A0ABP8V1V0_9GAMM
MRRQDLLALGFMTFALFLGAGNVIYPPMVGQQAGDHLLMAAAGFLITAVGLPLMTLVSMALAGGPQKMTADIPRRWHQLFWTALFLVIGPAFAIPRMAVVAYEMGFLPFVEQTQGWHLALYSAVFYLLAWVFALNPGSLIKTVGKLMTPALILLLAAIAWGTLSNPQGAITFAVGDYAHHPFSEGLVQGYMTMDCLAALGFGAVIANTVRSLGVTQPVMMARYTVYAGLMAAVGLGLVYLVLMYLGATSHEVAGQATNGGQVLALYVAALFGLPGKVLLASVITLACLTTAVGVGASCANFFSTQSQRLSYTMAITVIMLVSAVVANVGLTQLITLSVPVVVTLYPLAVAFVVLGLLRRGLSAPGDVYFTVTLVTACFAVLDGLKAAGLLPTVLAETFSHWLPLFDAGLGWLLPFAVTLVTTWAGQRYRRALQPQS